MNITSFLNRIGIIIACALVLFLLWTKLFPLLIATSGFSPHGDCLLWNPKLLTLFVASDASIGLAYIVISATLAYFVAKVRHSLPFHWIFLAFGIFIIACGATHLFDVWTLWVPVYWLAGAVKLVTAIASITTATILPFILPSVFALIATANSAEEQKRQLAQAHHELESLYEQSKELDQLKTNFFSNMSHELRTPLTLILGPITSLLAQETFTNSQHQTLQIIARNADLLLKRINNLLDIGKLEVGKIDLTYTSVDLVQLAQESAAYFEVQAAQQQILVSVEAPRSVLVEMDREKLERVFFNLFANAFKFTPSGGQIRCMISPESEWAIITLQDTGPGIQPELRQQIFKRFQQGSVELANSIAGTGLGLAIVKEFVELHDGTIDVDDAPGGGARFTIHIPLHAPHGSTIKDPSSPTMPSPLVSTPTNQETSPHVHSLPRETSPLQTASHKVAPLPSFLRLPSEGIRAEKEEQEAHKIFFAKEEDYAHIMLAIREEEEVQVMRVTRQEQDDQITLFTKKEEDVQVMLAARQEQEVQAILAARQEQEVQANILIIEDNQDMAQYIASILAPNYHVTLAFDGQDGLEKALQRHPDLVLSDILMPRMNGEQFITEFRQHTEFEAVPVMLISAQTDNTLRVRLLQLGAQDFLLKPFQPNEVRVRAANLIIMKLVREVLQHEVAQQQHDLVSLASEVTQSKHESVQAVAARGQSERDFRLLTDTMPQMVWTSRPDGQQDYYNQRWFDYTGMTLKQTQNLGWEAVLHPDDLQKGLDAWMHSVQTGDAYEIEYRFKRASDDTYRWHLGRALPMRDKGGKIIKWFGTCTDIDDQKRTEEVLRESEYRKDLFLSMASHELKTPLTSLQIFAELLHEECDANGLPGMAPPLAQIEAQIQRMQKLINNLLDTSRVQMSKLTLSGTWFHVDEFLQQIISTVQPGYPHHPISVSGDISQQIYADKDRLGQVLINLLSNAVKYSSQGAPVAVNVVIEQGKVTMTVHDEGIGIPRKHQAHIFECFYRVYSDQDRKYPGLGIGLYIAAEIIQRHGGQIWLESEEDRGSTFCFSFPFSHKNTAGEASNQ